MGKGKGHFGVHSVFTIILIIVVVCTGTILYSKKLYIKFNEEITDSLSEISSQSTANLENMIEGELKALQTISRLIAASNLTDYQELAYGLQELTYEYQYNRVAVANTEGIAYTTDGYVLDISGREYFQRAVLGEVYVSEPVIDKVKGDRVNVYALPLYEREEIIGIIIATRKTEIFQNMLEVKTFEGKGYSYIVKSNGDAVIASSHETSFPRFNNIKTSLIGINGQNTVCAEKIMEAMQNGESDYIIFHNKVDKYMYYRPLSINDWYLLSVVPVDVVSEKINFVMKWTYGLCAVIVSTFSVLLFYLVNGQKKHRRELENIVYIDSLTGGMTFVKFKLEAKKILQNNEIEGRYAFAAMDIDKFKYINDIFGYEEGNYVITYIWKQLNAMALPGEIFAHRTADRFVMLIYYQNEEESSKRFDDLLKNIKNIPMQLEKNYEIVMSIGIYPIYNLKLEIDKMIDRAEIIRKEVKGNRNLGYAFYDETIRQKLLRDKELESRMSKALENEEFFICYQPKYNTPDQRVIGAEALVRWRSEDDVIAPAVFIPLFESNGFIMELDKYVFERVCKDLRNWLDKGTDVVPISVNLSQMQLYNQNLVKDYDYIRQKYNIPPELLELELTETTLFENAQIMHDMVVQLREKGFQILMDDFGKGYSSLNMLKTIPVDVIKLDKSFVDDIGEKKVESIIQNIISLAQDLNMKVIAEGVENKEQFLFLCSVKCDEIQGFYFSKPIVKEEFENLISNQKYCTF